MTLENELRDTIGGMVMQIADLSVKLAQARAEIATLKAAQVATDPAQEMLDSR